MSNYRRLISYIYAYEGGVKGKNIGFAKIETRGIQCKITVSVKKIYVGGNDIGVYLLAGEEEIFLGNIFIRGGSGEFRTVVTVSDVEHSGVSMEECCGLTVHDVDNTWRSYTTIWEDAVAHAAEVELGDNLVNKKEAEEAVREARIKNAVREIEEEFPLEPSEGEFRSYIGNRVPAVEFSEELMPEMETGKRDAGQGEKELERVEPAAMEEESAKTEAEVPKETEQPEKIEEPEYADSQKEIREPDYRIQPDTAWNDMDAEQNVHYYQNTGWEAEPGWDFPENVQDNIVCYRADTAWNQEMSSRNDYDENQDEAVYQIDTDQSMEPDYAQPLEYTDEGLPDQQMSQPDTFDQTAREEENYKSAPGDPDELERLRRLEEEEENSQNRIWEKLSRERTKIFAFDYEKGCEILTIKPQDIGLLPREVWVYGNNSFLLHGYYNYRYLILAKLNNPHGTPRYLLGVPGHYYSNEYYMASMFGFPDFVLSKDQPAGDGRFGYWYTDIKIDQ